MAHLVPWNGRLMTVDARESAWQRLEPRATSQPAMEFDYPHAAGVTRYRVIKPHRTPGYFECLAIAAVSGTHHFVGSIQIMSRADIDDCTGKAVR